MQLCAFKKRLRNSYALPTHEKNSCVGNATVVLRLTSKGLGKFSCEVMSIILQLASVRCFRHIPLRSIRCYASMNPALTLPVASRIDHFMPRNIEIEQRDMPISQSPYKRKASDDFILIYQFHDYHILRLSGLAATFLSLAGVYALYLYKSKQEDPTNDEKGTVSIAESEPPVHEEAQARFGIKFRFVKSLKEIIDKTDIFYNFLILPFIILLLLYSRTSVVLCSYRRGNEYLTSVTNHFGLGSRTVRHGPHEVICYPNRKVFQHELHGEKIFLFSDYFLNSNEEHLMCFGKGPGLASDSEDKK